MVRDLLRQRQEQRLVLEAVQVLVRVRVNHLGGKTCPTLDKSVPTIEQLIPVSVLKLVAVTSRLAEQANRAERRQ